MTVNQQARELCAKLLPHTTSVQNVELIAEALEAAAANGLSKRDWKIIKTCLILRQKDLALRKGAAGGEYRLFEIQRLLGRLS